MKRLQITIEYSDKININEIKKYFRTLNFDRISFQEAELFMSEWFPVIDAKAVDAAKLGRI